MRSESGVRIKVANLEGLIVIARRPLLVDDGVRRRLSACVIDAFKARNVTEWYAVGVWLVEIVTSVDDFLVLVIGVQSIELDGSAGVGVAGRENGGSRRWRTRLRLPAARNGKNRGGGRGRGRQEETVEGNGNGEEAVGVGSVGAGEGVSVANGGGKYVSPAVAEHHGPLLLHLRL